MQSILINFYRRVLPAVAMSVMGIVAFSSATLTAPAKTQLLSRKCTTSGYVIKRSKDISVGRELYTSQFTMYADRINTARLACDITRPQPGAFKTLELEMGINDEQSSPTPMTTVFFNGKEVFKEALKKGPIKKISLDVRNVRSVTIEVWYPKNTRYNGNVYFVKAELLE